MLAVGIQIKERFDEFWTRAEVGPFQAIQRKPQVRKSLLGRIRENSQGSKHGQPKARLPGEALASGAVSVKVSAT